MVPKISVITCTNRYGGIDINWSSLRRQVFHQFEWILCDTLYDERRDAVANYVHGDVRVRHFKQWPKQSGVKTWLAHAENQAIKETKGELVVFLQDYIHIDPQGLEKFWIQYKDNPKRMITGVGHQYGKPGKENIVNPKGLITIFDKPFEGTPKSIVWQDPRSIDGRDWWKGSFYKCIPNYIEFNYCAIPRKALFDIGGCDEELDYWGHAWDNVSVAIRASLLGYESWIDQTNESKSVRHDDFFGTQVKDTDWRIVSNKCSERLQLVKEGKLKINYL